MTWIFELKPSAMARHGVTDGVGKEGQQAGEMTLEASGDLQQGGDLALQPSPLGCRSFASMFVAQERQDRKGIASLMRLA
ncbi:MAG: hypothetical protein RLZZ408_325 [Verrucomicrobiota bacterium]